jgi:hypothetical protein
MFQRVYHASESSRTATSIVTLLQMRLCLSDESLLSLGNIIVMRGDTSYEVSKIKQHIDSAVRVANSRRPTVICGRSGRVL